MSLYTRFASGLLFPLHERLKGHGSVALRRELERSQWLDATALERLREARLGQFLMRASRSVPYYRELFAAQGLRPAPSMPLSALASLPMLDKPTIRAQAQRLKAADAGPLKPYNTGGSSGEPLRFWIDRERVSHDVAAKWRATRWWGVDIGDPEIVVWGSPIELGAQDRLRQLRDRLLRTQLLSAFQLDEATLDHYLRVLQQVRPRMLFGYPTALAGIAAHGAARGMALDALGIRVVFVTSEQLFPDQRERIARAFGCPVANGYGGRDFGFVAHECPSGRLHLSAEDIIVEIVDAEGRVQPAGTAGEVVVTHLRTPGFPFIRYRTGDIAVLDPAPCSCGRGLPVLREVQGRTTDFVVTTSGAKVHALALIYVVRDLEGIRQFRIVQQARDRLSLELVRDPGFREALLPEIERQFRLRLGQDLQVSFRFVDAIAPASSGKHRYVVNEVPPG
ncbi:MAG: phenylacetate--CoA ligase family protein [Gammaproteobacteria bacterium]|nr:MAG: phenylacetate--CoA ligase family protein [Gammaproteobacteria bacterium]